MNYGSASYWDERYAAIEDANDNKNYDWYVLHCSGSVVLVFLLAEGESTYNGYLVSHKKNHPNRHPLTPFSFLLLYQVPYVEQSSENNPPLAAKG